MPDAAVIETLTDKSQQNASKKDGDPVLNLDSKIVIDGKQVSVADLVASHKNAEALKGQLNAAQRTMEAAKVLYGKDSPTAGAAETAYRELLAAAGRTADEIEAEITATKGVKKETKNPETPAPGTNEPAPQKDKTMELLHKATVLQIKDSMLREVKEAIGSDKNFQAYVKHIEERDGAEAAKGFVDSNYTQAYNILQMNVSNQLDQRDDVSVVFGDKLKEAAKKAVDEVVGKARQYLGDPKRLGKSTGVHSGEDPFQVSDTPVERPRYDKTMSTSDLETKLEARMTDQLVRSVKAQLGNPAV